MTQMNHLRQCAFAIAIAALAVINPSDVRAQAPQSVPGVQTIDSDGVIALIGKSPDLVIIDARHEKDFQEGHIEGALRLLDDDMLAAGPILFGKVAATKTTPLLFYCNGPACGRAAKSAAAAAGWGYGHISYYYAGIPDWRGKNLPLVK